MESESPRATRKPIHWYDFSILDTKRGFSILPGPMAEREWLA